MSVLSVSCVFLGPGLSYVFFLNNRKFKQAKTNWINTFKMAKWKCSSSPHLYYLLHIVPSLPCLLPVSSSGLGLSFAILSCLPIWPWFSSAQPWNTYVCQTDRNRTDVSRKKQRRPETWQPSQRAGFIAFKVKAIATLSIVIHVVINNADIYIKTSLRTWAGFVASPTLCSALSPPSAAAGWSVYGKRDKTAICVALSQKTPFSKTSLPFRKDLRAV